jgi:hypothetical protein
MKMLLPSQLHYENNPPIIVQELSARNPELYAKSLEVYRKVKDILDTRVSQVFPDYTLHNVNHSLRIMHYMSSIIPEISELSDLEIALLIYSALLHDVGMGANNQEVKDIEAGKLKYKDLDYQAFLKKFGNNTRAIQDYIRRVHAIRSSDFVKNELPGLLVIPEMPNTTFEEEVALICRSHTEDVSWIKKNLTSYAQKGVYIYNSVFCAMVLRMADILDFDSERTPPVLYKVLNPQGISKDEWEQHFTIDNASKITEMQGQKEIELFGRCSNSNIHRKVLKYIDWINDEIENINFVTANMEAKYKVSFRSKVNNHIKSEGYTFADLRFSVNFKQVTKLLMGEQIYGSKKLGLRELIQNAIDACKTRKEIEDSRENFDEYFPTIRVILDEANNEVRITDNGTGMTIEVLKKYFLNVGSSYYTSDDFLLRNLKHKPIGNYGIGFLACFMLSDKVIVRTRHFKNSLRYEVELVREDEFVSIKEIEDVTSVGTEIVLLYDQFMSIWENIGNMMTFLQKYFISDEFKIEVIDKERGNRTSIINPLFLEKEVSKENELRIDLSKYLLEVSGEVYIKNPEQLLFSNDIDDVPFSGPLYYFNGKKLVEFSESNIAPTKLVIHDTFRIINIPIIENKKILEKMIEVLDDHNQAFERYIEKENPEYVSIVTSEELLDTLKEGVISRFDYILDNLSFDSLIAFGQDEFAETIVELDKYLVFHLPGNEFFLLLDDRSKTSTYHTNPNFGVDMYVKDVFVKSTSLLLNHIIRRLNPEKFKINIKNSNIVPRISRNDFNESQNSEIITAIYQAICLGIHDSLKNNSKKVIIMEYLRKYFGTKSILLKEEYAKLIV